MELHNSSNMSYLVLILGTYSMEKQNLFSYRIYIYTRPWRYLMAYFSFVLKGTNLKFWHNIVKGLKTFCVKYK